MDLVARSVCGETKDLTAAPLMYLATDWDSSLVAPYAVTANQLGHEAPEVSPWRLNLINTYTFDHGAIKGLFVGGAFREEAGRIIGYHFSSTFVNSISSDPNYAGVISLTQGGLDVNDPYRGKNDWHIDAWVGYSRKLTRSIDWRFSSIAVASVNATIW